jgi:hypothetical protein
MLEHYFLKAKTIDRIRQSWIAESIEKYVVWLEDHGHSKQTIHRRVPMLVQFGEYAKEHGAKSVADLRLLTVGGGSRIMCLPFRLIVSLNLSGDYQADILTAWTFTSKTLSLRKPATTTEHL